MNEKEVIQKTKQMPLTVGALKNSFKKLGVRPGMVLLVHSSLSSLGWVCGGPTAVIMALEEVLGLEGTLVMPTCSGDLSEPSKWENPPVPQSWWPVIRKEMPAYNPDLTPTRGMGAIPETFRKQEGTLRSGHPQVSFAARGKHAREIIVNHSLDYAMGENSPLARLYDLNGWVLLLGVAHSNNTSIHLAEYRADYPSKKVELSGSPVFLNGQRHWQVLEDIEPNESELENIGVSFEKCFPDKFSKQKIGEAQTRLFKQRDIVDYAIKWITTNRR